MTKERFIITPNASLAHAARLFLNTGEDVLWVCDRGKSVGVLTKQDLLRAFINNADAAHTFVTEVMEGRDHFAEEPYSKRASATSGKLCIAVPDDGHLVSAGGPGGARDLPGE